MKLPAFPPTGLPKTPPKRKPVGTYINELTVKMEDLMQRKPPLPNLEARVRDEVRKSVR